MNRTFFALAGIVMMISSCRTNPFLEEWNTPYGIPPFDKIKVQDYIPAVKAGIAEQTAEIQAIIDCADAPTFANVCEALDRSGMTLEKVCAVLFNLSESDYSEALNAAVEEAMPLVSAHSDNIYMNPALFAKVKAVFEADQSGLTREQQMLLKGQYEAFVNNGVALPAEAQARLKDINSELSSLTLTFGNNLLAESNAFKAETGFSVANYYDEMTSTADRALREKYFRLYSGRGANGNANDNRAVVLREMQLRIERAQILGYDTPAAQILSNKMAKTPAAVDSFLAGIMKAAAARCAEEIADMQKYMDKDIAAGILPAGTKIQPWDYLFYGEKVRKDRYAFDEAEAMKYFKMENVRAGVFGTASKLYGLQFKPIEGAALYNPECEAFEVSDSDGSLIGVIITDYYPRDTKRGGAWMTNFVNQYAGVRPVIVNVGNFNKPTADTPSLLTIDQVETMWHEFGHALHGLLSQCTYRSVSGTSVVRDFVELPSQINENWAFEPEVLATYAFHYETDEVIPAGLVRKMNAAANFNQGFWTAELAAASILDMKWHELSSIEGVSVEGFEAAVCAQMGLPVEIIPRYRSTYFNHIFGSSGYNAGYYSYLWAEVLDKDAFNVFRAEGILNHSTAMRFRRCVLEKGGGEEPMTLYKAFAGREPDASALLKARGLR